MSKNRWKIVFSATVITYQSAAKTVDKASVFSRFNVTSLSLPAFC